jgi:hypothetical protein
MPDLNKAVWRKSSRSNNTQNCVEVAHLPNGGFAIRDSKQDGAGPILRYTLPEWEAFIAGVKRGEFDSRPRRCRFPRLRRLVSRLFPAPRAGPAAP